MVLQATFRQHTAQTRESCATDGVHQDRFSLIILVVAQRDLPRSEFVGDIRPGTRNGLFWRRLQGPSTIRGPAPGRSPHQWSPLHPKYGQYRTRTGSPRRSLAANLVVERGDVKGNRQFITQAEQDVQQRQRVRAA